ncbi:aminotransferase class V-fold PLP-dependent enzyme [Clostridium sp. DJ247]|uniref:aminotransferase class V-fold PLP-dependent enzyme n=1 Tax=Clostridium sp. DJ247 TaxID=2726188 RepID=UPI00162AE206|nr:aminotransferase class V-fold PLP-dependent enzyme [Clostridium sp. DJ247]MBC2582219.1 aminotransferase class V-fold PLP-dependent enzyme [Clostridium sp. DJ247]
MKIYLDNAATTYPKPDEVYCSVLNYMKNIGANPGRGGYHNALEGDRIVYSCREALMNLFNFDKLENVIFTANITQSLNILLKNTIKDGWHVITSSMEHNSVLRPLSSVKKSKKIELDILDCSEDGIIDVEDFKKSIKPNTKLIVLSHSSNVIGSIQPLETIGKICKEHNIYYIIDSAQSAGSIPVDFCKLQCSALAFTGHKGLLGPQGIGGFLIDDKLNKEVVSFIEGGTGSSSQSIIQPEFLPDKFESGTLNAPGIAGLLAGINYITQEGICSIKERESELCQHFTDNLLNIPSIKVYGLKESSLKTPTISINSTKVNNAELGFILDKEFGIMARTGLHCAPLAHKTIGTFPAGTIRFSLGPFNDKKDIDYTLHSLNSILKRM